MVLATVGVHPAMTITTPPPPNPVPNTPSAPASPPLPGAGSPPATLTLAVPGLRWPVRRKGGDAPVAQNLRSDGDGDGEVADGDVLAAGDRSLVATGRRGWVGNMVGKEEIEGRRWRRGTA